MNIRKLGYALVLAGLLCGVGCGVKDDKIQVSGTVFLDDTPLAGASLAFIGNNGGAYSSATSDSKGAFTLRAAPGMNKVAVNKMNTENLPPTDPNADQTMPTEAEYAKMLKNAPKPLVAERFTDPEKSGIMRDVARGMLPLEIHVTSK